MRVSQEFKLDKSQAELDFIDVDVQSDTRAYIDPRAIKRVSSAWADGCVGLLQDFFDRVLEAVQQDDQRAGLTLLAGLSEPNETHLGLSRKRARGSGVGSKLARDMWRELRRSEAARTGLITDLEETALVIKGIGLDRISDITTNIIRRPLIDYTQEMAEHYGLPMQQVASGHIWDPRTGGWEAEQYVRLPVTRTGRLVLVPKLIVRKRLDFDPGEYYRHYVLTTLMDRELSAGTSLVHVLKSKKKRVYKKEVEKKYKRKRMKTLSEEITLEEPNLLARYRADKEKRPYREPPLTLHELQAVTGGDIPDWDDLLDSVTSLSPGASDATAYHRAVESLLTAIFYPSLTVPRIESELHQGRKRVDIRYTNSGIGGFFEWALRNYAPQPFVFVECKNYVADLNNDSLDQISGRFSRNRGTFGFLVCRRFSNKNRFIERCRDTASDGRGFVLTLDDQDLRTITTARRDEDYAELLGFLQNRHAELVT